MKRYVTVGLTVLAGVALFEVALVPGVVIGGAAVLAPKYLPKLRKRLRPLLNATVHRPAKPAAPLREDRLDAEVPAAVLPKFAIGQAIAKTITFRIIVTTLDFTTNYLVIGELGTAAGLSTFNLVAGPLFYLGHEAAWSYLGPSEAALDLPVPAPLQRAGGEGSRSAGRWRRRSPFGRSPRQWTSPRTMWWSATWPRRWFCQLPASSSAPSFTSVTRGPGTISARRGSARSIRRRQSSCCRRRVDFGQVARPRRFEKSAALWLFSAELQCGNRWAP